MDYSWRNYQRRLNDEPSRQWIGAMALLCLAAAIVLGVLMAGCRDRSVAPGVDDDLGAVAGNDLGAVAGNDLGADLSAAPSPDLTAPRADDLRVATSDLAATDLVAIDLPTYCGGLMQHVCEGGTCHPGLVAMVRGNDPEDVHCFDPAVCGIGTGEPCCSINGGTTTVAWGYCVAPLDCQTTCQPVNE